jgi:DNA primase
VVAFTGRALAAEEPAKYLNSPETDLYHKSEVLFGFDRAKDAIRTRGFMILMEGQMDLLHAHQAGFTNTVALSGTALTERHLSLVKRYSENLMLALDADTAGLSATLKAALMALKYGMKVKAIRLPVGQDPADVISADANDFAKRSKESKPVAEFFLAVLAERERDPHRLVQNAEKVVLPLIAAMPSPLEREHLAGVVARGLGLSKETILEGVKKASREVQNASAPAAAKSQAPLQPRVSRGEILRAAVVVYPGTELAKRIENEYSRIVGVALDPGGSEAALFEAERTFGAAPKEDDADDLVRAFEEAYIREAHQEAVERLRRAEQVGTDAQIKEAQAACAELSAKLAAVH